MQNSEKIVALPHRFDIFLFEAFSNHCLANTVEPLRAANMHADRSLYEWRFCTLDGGPVHSSSGLQVAPHGRLSDMSGHTLVVMPSYGVRQIASRDLDRILYKNSARYGRLAGFDMGSWLLGQAGLLDGYRATIHWDELGSFAERFSEVEAVRERFVIDRDRITCSGAMAAFDLIIHLIAGDYGPLMAMDVAQLFMSHNGSGHTMPFGTGGGRIINRALAVMQDTVETPLAIPALARAVGCTQKTLETRMASGLQATPQAVYRHVRLTRARQLVMDTDLPISEIAQRCGYENASAMTRAYRLLFGHAPSAARRTGG